MAAPRGRGLRPGGIVRALGRLVLLVCVGFALGLLFGLVTEEPELLASHLRGEGESVDLGDRSAESAPPSEASNAAVEALTEEELRIAAPLRGQVAADERAGARGDSTPTSISPNSSERRASSADEYAAAATRIRRLDLADQGADTDPDLPAVAAARSIPVAAALEVPEAARQAARKGTGWSIQVGAFSDQTAARQLAEGLRDRYPVVVLPAASKDGRWRVRVQPIEGEAQARDMADRLKRDDGLPTWVTRAEGDSGS